MTLRFLPLLLLAAFGLAIAGELDYHSTPPRRTAAAPAAPQSDPAGTGAGQRGEHTCAASATTRNSHRPSRTAFAAIRSTPTATSA